MTLFRLAIGLLVVGVSLGISPRKCIADSNEIWPVPQRHLESERPIVVLIPQNELVVERTPYVPPNSTGCTACRNDGPGLVGQLLGGLLANKLQAIAVRNEQEVEDLIAVMKAEAQHFDFDAAAAATADSTAGEVPWLGTAPAQISKDETKESFEQLLDSMHCTQLFVVRYAYRLVHSLNTLELDTELALIDRSATAGVNPFAHVSLETASFVRRVNYYLPLRRPMSGTSGTEFRGAAPFPQEQGDSDLTNARTWLRDNARLLRHALGAIVAKTAAINTMALTTTEDDTIATKSGAQADACHGGWRRTISKDTDGTLCIESPGVWTYTFFAVDPPR